MKKILFILCIFLPLQLFAQDYYFHVKLKNPDDISLLKDYCGQKETMIIRQHTDMPLWYMLSTTNESEKNASEMVQEYQTCGLFRIASKELPDDEWDMYIEENLAFWEYISQEVYVPLQLLTPQQEQRYYVPVFSGQKSLAETGGMQVISYEIYHFPTTLLVAYGNFSHTMSIIDASFLPKGIYIVRILRSDGSYDVQKIVL